MEDGERRIDDGMAQFGFSLSGRVENICGGVWRLYCEDRVCPGEVGH